jgi:hypothetical protein
MLKSIQTVKDLNAFVMFVGLTDAAKIVDALSDHKLIVSPAMAKLITQYQGDHLPIFEAQI